MDPLTLIDHSRAIIVTFVFLAICMAVTLFLTTRQDEDL